MIPSTRIVILGIYLLVLIHVMALAAIGVKTRAQGETDRLRYVSYGFGFIAVGLLLAIFRLSYGSNASLLELAGVIMLLVGFVWLYLSLYR